MKKTPWFRGDQKPVRVGYYQRDYGGDGVGLDFWNGVEWGLWMSVAPFTEFLWTRLSEQNLPWRGVLK